MDISDNDNNGETRDAHVHDEHDDEIDFRMHYYPLERLAVLTCP
jgi:hypothetical protein